VDLKDRRPRDVAALPNRLLDRRLKAHTREEHGVAQEGVQLSEVVRPAVGQIDVRIRGDTDGNRRQLHELGVWGLLAAEHHQRFFGRPEAFEAAAQQLRRSKYPGHDQVTGLERLPKLRVAGSGRVRQDIVCSAGPR
jgi:hypothetical protein